MRLAIMSEGMLGGQGLRTWIFRGGLSLLVAGVLTLAGGSARADLLYSVDVGTGDLVTIDSGTGNVTAVLPLNRPLGDVDLAISCDGSTLYALNSFSDFRFIEILTIRLTPGPIQITSVQNVTLNGQAPNVGPPTPDGCGGEIYAEGLASVGNQLVIGFILRTNGSPLNCHSLSNAIGFLNPATGVISNPFDLISLSNPSSPNCLDCPFGSTCTPDLRCRADIDGMTALPNGQLLVVDGVNDGRFNSPARVEFVNVSWPANPITFVEVVAGGVLGIPAPNDVALSVNPTLFFGIVGPTDLRAFNLTNGSPGPPILLNRSGTYYGLALSPSPTNFGILKGRKINTAGGGGIAGWVLTATSTTPPFTQYTVTTDMNGDYTIPVPAGNYNICETLPLTPTYTQAFPTGQACINTNVLACNSSVGNNFRNTPATAFTDLAVTVGGSIAREGRTKAYRVCVSNLGTVARNYALVLNLPFPAIAAAPPPVVLNGNQVTWPPGTVLNPGAMTCYTATVMIPVGTLGQNITATTVVGNALDLLPLNNTAVDVEPVLRSWDPNEKRVTPEGVIEKTDLLRYQVNFQNVGNDTAFTVIVRDQLDPNLDLSSVVSGAGSAPYTFAMNGSELVWTFANIGLPDSTTDEAGSHGFITFEARPVSTVLPGTAIHNQAAIYFDFNDPVITNQVTNTIRIPATTATIDVDPNTINLSSSGRFVTVYIELPGGLSPADVDLSSVRLAGSLHAETKHGLVGDHDGDGVADLMVKFSRQALYPLLTLGDNELVVNGLLTTGESFEGTDVVRVINPGGGHVTASVAPNPLNPVGVLAFNTLKPGHVTVTMFDLQGRAVRTLMESALLAPGMHEVKIDGRGPRGEELPSGVYFYRIKSPDGTVMGRLAILK